MFDKIPKTSPDLGKTNRIVEFTQIKGDIVSQADFRFDGELEGNITCNGKLVIGPGSRVIGDIRCRNIDIEGVFEGVIEVEELLSVKASAKIKGQVTTGRLAVEPGAMFTATCAMKAEVKSISINEQQYAG
jgi:cytoskeletal protein CcmA (bactofilin family)